MSAEENESSLIQTGATPDTQIESSSRGPNASEAAEIGNLLASMERLSEVTQGEVVRAKVVKVTENEVLVDLGLKCEGSISRHEFMADDGRLTVVPGDLVDVWIDHYDEKEGTLSVSHQKATHLKVWEEIEQAFHSQGTLRGRVLERTKGGLTVDIGVRAFLPGSHADLRPLHNLDALPGQEIACKVIKINKKRGNVVVSRKLVMEEEWRQRKTELLQQLVEGAELVGRVKNLTDYGAFVDLGGMDGLLHITDLSWGRVGHPSEVVQVDQQIRVKVLKYDPVKERISLGLKQFTPDPWERMASAYPAGTRVTGRVTSIVDYGAFVELEPGVEGLIHISEMTWSKRLKHPSKVVRLGDRVEVDVLEVNPAQRRISLSLKQTLPDPWTALRERYAVGSVIQGRVRNLTAFGAFVEIQEGVDGLIHLSDLSRTKKLIHPSEVLRKGQKIEAVILRLDLAHRRLSLGLKQLEPDTWKDFFSRTQVGSLVRGRVSRLAPFGAFVELKEGIEGLCHISEVDQDQAGNPRRLEVGSEFEFRVIRLNPTEKKIGLSLRNLKESVTVAEDGLEKLVTEPEPLSPPGRAAPTEPLPSVSTAKAEF